MDIRKLQRAIVDGLEDVKAQHIAVFNTEHLSAMFERVIIASGTSNRQTKALAASVRDSVRKRGMEVMSVEGEDNGEWIIVDCGAAVAHIMQPAIREYYHLEEIWGGKNVKMKVGEVSGKLVKASEPEPEAKPARKRAPVNKGVSKEAIEKKAANRTAAFKRVAAGKGPAGKTAARKAPGSYRDSTAPATQTIVVKPKSAAKPGAKPAAKPAVKRPAAKKAAPVKTAAKAAPKTAAKAAPRSAPKAAAKPAAKPARKPARKTA